MANPPTQGHWHIDRTLNVGIIATIIMQSAIAIWWLSATNSHIFELDSALDRHEVRIATVEAAQQAQAVAAAATAQQITNIRDTLEQMRSDLRENNTLLRQVLGVTK